MTYDLVVIGSGPGGYSAAIRGSQYGLKTALVWERFVHSQEEGILCENPRLDFPNVQDRKNKIVSKHSKGVEFLMKKNKIDWVKGFGSLQPRGANGLHRVEVKSDSGTQTLETKNVIIATGSGARMIPGLEPDAKTILTNI